MKLLLILPLLLAFKPLPKKYRGFTKTELAQQIDRVKLVQSGRKKEIKKKKVIRKSIFTPSFGNQHESIATFERFLGVIDGHIISSGHQVNFKVDFENASKIPEGSYLSCTGTNLATKYNYRIIASCDRLITPEHEYMINVGLKDLTKVDGIKPDHVYTGDEEAILGEGFSAIMGGIIDARKERVQTAVGFSETPTIKNAYLNGLLNAARTANQKSKEHTSETFVVLAVKDKKKVIIEFKKRFTYENDAQI